MGQNCLPASEYDQFNGTRWGFDRAGRGAYSDPMSGVSRDPFSAKDLEYITQRLEAIKVAEACESEHDDNDSTDSDASLTSSKSSSIGSEITWEAYTTTQILAGAETAEKYMEDVRREYWNNVENMQERFWDVQGDSRQLVAFKTSELSYLQEYRRQLFHLIQVVKRQQEMVVVHGIQKNQHYRDRLASNAKYLPRLENQYCSIKSRTDIKEDELKKLEEAEDVAKASHPRHVELAWIFCYTDTCSTHRLSKEHFGYWPKKRKAIYWDHEPRAANRLATSDALGRGSHDLVLTSRSYE